MSGFNHYLEATLTPERNRVLKRKGSLSGYTIALGSLSRSLFGRLISFDHSLSIRLMDLYQDLLSPSLFVQLITRYPLV